jgi:aconitate hydratase
MRTPKTIAEKIIAAHLVTGDMTPGSEISIKIDRTLTQDATGTMAYIEFEAMGIDRVKTDLSVAYIDHNTLQSGFMNADDHRFIRTAAAKYGIHYSRPGNGICHQVNLERFAVPGKTLIGSDSHTPTAGGIGMLAFGAGGLDVAVAMGGGAYSMVMPKMYKVNLTGKLNPWVTAKDVSLEILRILSVKGGVGAVIEWGGEGVKTLTVPQRATITNMGAELGATTSIFPSDEITKDFLKAQGREEDYSAIYPDDDAQYDKIIDIDLSSLEPMAACPHSPDNIKKISELAGTPISQVCVGSCTNSSLADMLRVSAILKGRTVAPQVSMSVSPGSKQVLAMLADCGALVDIISSGARLLECACGPCIGMGFSPESGGLSLRTFNRNFEGRSGTRDAGVFLVSPEVAAASAITGVITDPRTLGEYPVINIPDKFLIDDSGVIPPLSAEEAKHADVVRGPNIKSYPDTEPMADCISVPVSLKVGDNITTDHIMPAGAAVLPYRSNIPKMSEFCFNVCDKDFPARAKACGKSIIVGGVNYGQGSSREHAALVPLYLGVKAVVAKSFARIHKDNLINAGILPLTFVDPSDYDKIQMGDEIALSDLYASLKSGDYRMLNKTAGTEIALECKLSDRQIEIILAGGLIALTAQGKN